MLEEAVADPNLARRFFPPILGTLVPVAGGSCNVNARDIGGSNADDRTFGHDCSDPDFYFVGKLGIGTQTPNAKLEVKSQRPDSGKNELLRLTNDYNPSGINEPTLRLDNGYGTQYWTVGGQVAGGKYFRIMDNELERLRIDSAGYIGIGTQTPAYPLDVDRNWGATYAARISNLSPSDAAHGLLVNLSSGNPTSLALLVLSSGGDIPGLAVTGAGRVGIGTQTPNAKLEVKSQSPATGKNELLRLTNDYNSSGINEPTLRLDNGYGTQYWTVGGQVAGGKYFRITDNDIERLRIDSNGNVEIGKLNQIVFLKPSGGDDRQQILDAINALPAQGGIIYLSPGTYNISNIITISKNGVKLRGYGGAWRDDGFHLTVSGVPKTVNNTGASPLTKLLWTGAAGGTIIELKPSVANTQVQDLEVADLSIDGAGVQGNPNVGAGIGLVLNRVTNSRFRRVEVRNIRDSAGSVGIKLTTDGTAFGMNTDWNLFDRCTVLLASECVFVTAEGSAVDSNSSHNTFIGLTVSYWSSNTSNVGVRLGSCDNNAFYDTFIFQHNLAFPNLGNGRGVVVDDPLLAAANYFYHLQAVGGFLVKNVNTGSLPADKNMIYGYDQGNGTLEPDPTAQNAGGGAVDPELVLFWTDSKVNMRGLGNLTASKTINFDGSGNVLKVRRYADLASALSLANFPATNPHEFGFVWDDASDLFYLVYNDGTNKWKWQGTQVTS